MEANKPDVVGKIGDIGEYSVDYTAEGVLDAKAGVEVQGVAFGIYARGNAKKLVINFLKGLAAKTSTQLDDKLLEWLEPKV